jgi:hypothetical protein
MTTTLMASPNSLNDCLPRWATKRSPERETLGAEIAAAAESFGQPLMPWQRLVADVGLELLPGTMIPAYREVVVTVPRQNGKTTLTLAFEVQRAVGWGGPQQIAYTAQTGKDAREKLINDQSTLLIARRAPIRLLVDRVLRGVGNEAITFKTGSRIFILNSGEDSGHGKTIDLGVIDESFADEDDRREQAMLPAMLTRPSAQILNISTAGTDKSPFLKRKVDAGRAAVADGVTQGIAYFEWSFGEDDDIDDPATWWANMPALGRTITEDVVRHARLTMTEGEFRRAMGNQWTISEDRVIPANVWNAVCSDSALPEGNLALGLDATPDRSYASIAVADSDGNVELIERRAGMGWVTEEIVRIAKSAEADVVLDGKGPAGSLAEDIENAGIRVHKYTTENMTYACGSFYDAVADGKIQIRHHALLDSAAAAVRKRRVGDSWLWGRQDASEDVCPLIAATLAFAEAGTLGDAFIGAWA